jgi:hypothetical protein
LQIYFIYFIFDKIKAKKLLNEASNGADVNEGLPRPSSLQFGIEISGKTMGALGLMGMR